MENWTYQLTDYLMITRRKTQLYKGRVFLDIVLRLGIMSDRTTRQYEITAQL